MNIKELAAFTGKNRTTIERWCAKCASIDIGVKVQNAHKGKPADFTLDEVEAILKAGTMSKDAVAILMENARNANLPAVNNQIDYEQIGRMIGMAVTAALSPVVAQLKGLQSQALLPEPVRQTNFSLVAYCRVKGIKINSSDLALHGKELKKMANRQGVTIEKIPDERWGFVNSYPVAILDEYFSI